MAKYILKSAPYIGETRLAYPHGTPCEISKEDLEKIKAEGIVFETVEETQESEVTETTTTKKKGK
jgi:hypothetical protein